MGYEADKVVVELIANTNGFDGNIKTTATAFDTSMSKIEASAGKAEAAHGKFTKSVGQSRAGMLEFQHVLRGSVDQFASGAPLTQIFAQHIASVGQAATLSGGALGKFGSIMAGPVGLAATAAIAIIATLISKHHEESNSVESLIAKLKEHAEKTANSEEADRLWSQTLDGLIERHRKLNEELSKRLEVQPLVDQANLRQQEADLTFQTQKLETERKRLADLQKDLASAQTAPVSGGSVPGAAAAANDARVAAIQKQIEASKATIGKLEQDLTRLQSGITNSQIIVGQTEGKAFADLTAKAKLFGDTYTGVLTQILQDNPILAAMSKNIQGAADSLVKAASDAAAAGVDFSASTNQVSALDRKLNLGQISVKSYTAEIAKLTKALKDQTEAAKEAAKINPKDQFKRSVIGAEGTGPNQMGSSAAGFGQFINSTWLNYFNRLFPDKAALSDAAKLGFRNIRSVAEAVIDKATDDYAAVLKDAGQKLTAANLYAVHVLGSKDAKKFFAAAPGAQTSGFLSQSVLAGNPFLKGTVAQASAAIAKRIGDSSSAVSQGAAALVQAQQQEAEREARFIQAKDQAEQDVIEARKALALSAEQIATFETAAVIAAHDRTADQIASAEANGKLLPQEAEELRKINDERAKYRQQLVDQRLRQAQFAQAEQNFQRGRDFQTASYDAEAQLLQSQQGLARTADKRREIEQRLIDLQFAEEKLKNQYIIDWAERVKANKDATDQEKADAALAEQIARMHQGTLDARHDNATAGNQQQNAGPLQSYFNSIPNTAGEIDDALQQVATHGLQNFTDALTDAIVNFHSLGDVGRAVLSGLAADLIKLAIQQVILHTIGQALGTASIAATTAQAAAAGAAWAGPAALASLATLGANAAPAAAALASTTALATLLGAPKAAGGRILGPGSDTSDNILTPMSPGEFAIKARSARSIGYDALEFMNEHGRMPGLTSGGVFPTNASAAHGSGRGGFSQDDIRTLTGIVSEAAKAMPDVSLYASLDPADMLQRALGAPAGHRAMLAYLNNNTSAVKVSLNRP